jgi:SAM-dependent methyltransferase
MHTIRSMTEGTYVGQELDLFAHALNWKKYWSSSIKSYVRGDVLEVGAGIGANTIFLKSNSVKTWTCLEPDSSLAARMSSTFATDPTLADCQIRTSTTSELGCEPRFDSILYVDVIEHIADDRKELEQAACLLRDKGRIIVLAPAHQFLYTPFDKAIGHFRRYDKASMKACTPTYCDLVNLLYLDSAGLLASVSNRLLLRQSMPSIKQIVFWDKLLIPQSRFLDRLTFNKVGKSILAIWQKHNPGGDRH